MTKSQFLVEVHDLPIATHAKVPKLRKALLNFFTRHDFTPVATLFRATHPGTKHGKTNGKAMVAFASRIEAAEAVAKLNHKYLMPKGKANKLRVKEDRSPPGIDLAWNPRTGQWLLTQDGKQITPDKAYAGYMNKDTRFRVVGATFDSLPEEIKREMSAYLPLDVTGMGAVDTHTHGSVTKEMRKRSDIANAKVYEAIGLLRTNPDRALRLVRQHIGDADPNASVPPWVSKPRPNLSVVQGHSIPLNLDHLESANILLQVILDKFRHGYDEEIWDHIDVQQPIAERSKVDTARYEIIKLLLENGAIFDEETIDAAFSMHDLATILELERRSPIETTDGRCTLTSSPWAIRSPKMKHADFWDEKRLYYQEYQGQGEYEFQEINGKVTSYTDLTWAFEDRSAWGCTDEDEYSSYY